MFYPMENPQGYDQAQALQLPGVENFLWGIVKTLQGWAIPIAVLAILGLGILLMTSGDNTGRKNTIITIGGGILVGLVVVLLGPSIIQAASGWISGK